MSNTKHTPGEWKACHDGKCSCGSINSDHFPIAITVGKNNSEDAPYVTEDERKANAKLIAAAPELLEALMDCVGHVELDMGYDNQIVIKAKAAIKKATE